MFLLAIETTGFNCSVALLSEDGRILEKSSADRLNHLKDLTPLIKVLLDEKNIAMKAVDYIAASCGPGSFTGIRIGISTARAISQITGAPCIGVDSMEAMALSCQQRAIENCLIKEEEKSSTIVCPLVDARQNQVYSCLLKEDAIVEKTFVEDIDVALDKIKSALLNCKANKILFAGDAIEKYEPIKEFIKTLEYQGIDVKFTEEGQRAKSVAILASKLADEGSTLEYAQLLPNYMRKPEAQRRLEERLK